MYTKSQLLNYGLSYLISHCKNIDKYADDLPSTLRAGYSQVITVPRDATSVEHGQNKDCSMTISIPTNSPEVAIVPYTTVKTQYDQYMSTCGFTYSDAQVTPQQLLLFSSVYARFVNVHVHRIGNGLVDSNNRITYPCYDSRPTVAIQTA